MLMMYKVIIYGLSGLLTTTSCASMIDNVLQRNGDVDSQSIELYEEYDKKIDGIVDKYAEIMADKDVPISSKNVSMVKLASGRSIKSILNSTGYTLPEGYIVENGDVLMDLLRMIKNIKNKTLDELLDDLDGGNKVITQDELPRTRIR